MHKYFVYRDFRQHLQYKARFKLQHFQGQVPPRCIHACRHPCLWRWY